MFDENFTFDRKGAADTSSRRDTEEPESAMSPKEVYAELPPPPPPSLEAATQQSAAAAAAAAYAANNPPTGKEATATATEPDTVDSLARQLGRQTLLQEDPQYQWRRSQQQLFAYEPGPFYDQRIVPRSSSPSRQSAQYIPLQPVQEIGNQPPSCSQPLSPPSSADTNQIPNSYLSSSSLPPSLDQQFETPPLQQQPCSSVLRPVGNQANNTRAIRENLLETMIANNYQCNVQNSEPATPVSASLPPFFAGAPASSSCSSSSVTNHDGDTLMTDPTRSIQVDQDWGDDEPMVRLLSYRRAGAMTRVQKLGLSFRSAQHTALQCANLKPNKTRMRRRDRKPSKAQPTPAPTPSAVGASST
ncbi:hypothetical protein PG985_015691 [Apiospora marii]|uniref:Uncharacterized protein n=1 Tax=Apiospora marii TaxID=335849 RepID=A0ABR1S4Q7_9PEZI